MLTTGTTTTLGKTVMTALSAVGGALSWFLGGLDGLLIAVLALMIIDYVTGVLCAISEKKLSSDVGRKGLCKKAGMVILIGCMAIIDQRIIGQGSTLRDALITGFLINEIVSVLENASRLGIPVPDKIKTILSQLKDRENKKE